MFPVEFLTWLYVENISCLLPPASSTHGLCNLIFRQATLEACIRAVRWFTYKNSSGSSSDFFRKFIYSLQIHSYFCYNKLMSCTYAIDWSAMFLICHTWFFYCPGTGVVRGRGGQNHSICRTIRNSCYSDNKRNHWCLASECFSNR